MATKYKYVSPETQNDKQSENYFNNQSILKDVSEKSDDGLITPSENNIIEETRL